MRNIVLKTVVGSFALGIDNESSDIDFFSVFIPSKDELLGISRFKESAQHKFTPTASRTVDISEHSLKKYLLMLIKGSSRAIIPLFVGNELISVCSKAGEILRENREKFLSIDLVNHYVKYAEAEYDKYLRSKCLDMKAASNSLHLLIQAIKQIKKGKL